MIGGKVHLGEDVVVVLNLRTIGQHKAHTRENVDNLVGNDGERMACTQLDRVWGTSKVECFIARLLSLALLAQLVNALGG